MQIDKDERIRQLKDLLKLSSVLSTTAYKVVNADAVDLSDAIKDMKNALIRYDEAFYNHINRQVDGGRH